MALQVKDLAYLARGVDPDLQAEKQSVLVMGGTGLVGGAVVRGLLSFPWYRVLVATRRPWCADALLLKQAGAVLVEVDYNYKHSLVVAMKGVKCVFLHTIFWENYSGTLEVLHGKNAVEAAQEAGVEHLVFDGTNYVKPEKGRICGFLRSKLEIENIIVMSGIAYTIVVLPFYYENFLTVFRPYEIHPDFFAITIPLEDCLMSCACLHDMALCIAKIIQQGRVYYDQKMTLAAEMLSVQQMISNFNSCLKGLNFIDPELTVDDFQEFAFPGAKDLAAMFLFYQLCEDIPDFSITRTLNPHTRNMVQWIMDNKEQLYAVLDEMAPDEQGDFHTPPHLRFTEVLVSKPEPEPEPEPRRGVSGVSDPFSSDEGDGEDGHTLVTVTSKPLVHLVDKGEEETSNKSNNSDDQLSGLDLKDTRGNRRSSINLSRPDSRTRSYLALQKFLADDFKIVSRLHARRPALTGFEQLDDDDLRLFDRSYRKNAIKETSKLLRLVKAVRRFRQVSNRKSLLKAAPLAEPSVHTLTVEQAARGKAARSWPKSGSLRELRKDVGKPASLAAESRSRTDPQLLYAAPFLHNAGEKERSEDDDDMHVGQFLDTLVHIQMNLGNAEASSGETTPTLDPTPGTSQARETPRTDNVRGEITRTDKVRGGITRTDNVRGETDRTDNAGEKEKSEDDDAMHVGQFLDTLVHIQMNLGNAEASSGETTPTLDPTPGTSQARETSRTDNVRGETTRTDKVRGGITRTDNVRGETDRTDNVRGEISRTDNVRGEITRTDNVRGEISRTDNVRGETDRTDNVRGETDRTDNVRGEIVRTDNVRGETDRTDNVRGETDRTDNVRVKITRTEDNVRVEITRTDNVRGETDRTDNVRGETDRTDNVRGETDRTDNVRGETDRTDNVRGETDRTDNVRGEITRTDNVRGETDRTDNVRGETDRTDNVRGETDRTDNVRGETAWTDIKATHQQWPSVTRTTNLACFPRRHEADYSNNGSSGQGQGGEGGVQTPFSGLAACLHGGKRGWGHMDSNPPGYAARSVGPIFSLRGEQHHENLPGYAGGYPDDCNLPGYAGGYPDDYNLPGYAGGYPDDYILPGYAGGYPDDYNLPGYAGGYPDDYNLPGYVGGADFSLGLRDRTAPSSSTGGVTKRPSHANSGRSNIGMPATVLANPGLSGRSRRGGGPGYSYTHVRPSRYTLCSQNPPGYSYTHVRPSRYTLCSQKQSTRTGHAVAEENYNQSADKGSAFIPQQLHEEDKLTARHVGEAGEQGSWSRAFLTSKGGRSTGDEVAGGGCDPSRQGDGPASLKANPGRRTAGAPCLELPDSVQSGGPGRAGRATSHHSVNHSVPFTGSCHHSVNHSVPFTGSCHHSVNHSVPFTGSCDNSTDMASSHKESHADSAQQKHTASPGHYLDILDDDPYHFELNNKINAAVKALCTARRERLLNATPDTRIEHLLNTTPDTRIEHLLNTTPDTRIEHLLNVTPDTRIERLLNVTPDTQRERMLNTTPDTRIENLVNATPDTRIKNLLNTTPDTQRERLLNATPDTQRERLLNTTPDTQREHLLNTTPDTRRESVMDTEPPTLVQPFTPQRSASSASEEEGEYRASLSPRSSLTSVVTSTTASETSNEAERDAVREFERSNQVLVHCMRECQRRWYYHLTNNLSTSPVFPRSQRFAFTTGLRVLNDRPDMLASLDSSDTSASSGWDEDENSNK